jgi:hypothetical protein
MGLAGRPSLYRNPSYLDLLVKPRGRLANVLAFLLQFADGCVMLKP